MIDQGLLVSIVVIAVVVSALNRALPPTTIDRPRVVDELSTAAIVGVLAGRVVAMALDDPSGLSRVGDILVIRGGVEFWPGVLAGAAAIAWRASRGARLMTLIDMTPPFLWGYAAYELTCLVRAGCFGPESAVGLRPDGLGTRQLPVGVLVGLVVATLGVVLRRWRCQSRALQVAVAIGALAVTRSVASVWLPRVSAGLTRQHITSLAVAGAATVVGGGIAITQRGVRGAPTTAPDA